MTPILRCLGASINPGAVHPGSSARAAGPIAEATSIGTTTGRAGGGFVEVATGRGTEQVLVPTAWLTDRIADSTTPRERHTDHSRSGANPHPDAVIASADPRHDTSKGTTVRVENRSCDSVTGALLDQRTSSAYRPPERIAALVRQRDGTCRFPGCSIAARLCDLDHVRPWPAGPTSPANLICLCRRHHRIKQRPGWRVTLHPDATVTWTDPTGRRRTTLPVDALHTINLPAPAPTTSGPATGVATVLAGADRDVSGTRDRFSRLEYALEHLLGADLANLPTRTSRGVATRRPIVTAVRPVDRIEVVDPFRPCRRPRHRAVPDLPTLPDLPPF